MSADDVPVCPGKCWRCDGSSTHETNDGERLLGEWQRGEIPVDAVLTFYAAREAEVRRDIAERIAQAIEALPLDDGGWPVGEYDMRCQAVDIAREEACRG